MGLINLAVSFSLTLFLVVKSRRIRFAQTPLLLRKVGSVAAAASARTVLSAAGSAVITWRLKRGGDRRVRQGHPWVFAGELASSAKELRAGELVELRDDRDHFVAYGYGHPTSQICFRKLSSRQKEMDVLSVDFFVRRLTVARELRRAAGWSAASHRWLFAEADGVPGLIIDAFKIADGWVVVAQASTVGADRALPQVFEALATFEVELGGTLTLIEAPSSRARVAEGLAVGEKRVVHGSRAAADLGDVTLELIDGLTLRADLLGGQKTGFFLDQQWNATLMKTLLRRQFAAGGVVRVLDVCSYVGQWSAHATQALRAAGAEVHATVVDVSAPALAFAEANVRAAGAAEVTRVEGDVLKDLGSLAGEFDVVICDPPAFVKKKADLEPGLRAYVKLNRDALKITKPGGLFVASSCSGLVKTADYQRVMAEATQKAGRVFKQIQSGGHAPDHPTRPEFPEGEYLKCFFGRVEYPY